MNRFLHHREVALIPINLTPQTMRKIELLAPARNVETGIEAILHGADAVYIGGPGFGARAAAGNSVEDIRHLCAFAHTFWAKVYVTLNTILYDEELPEVEKLVHALYDAGVDALITQDLALLTLDIPPIPLHASTQMDNCTPEKARMLEAAGYSQIVLARELSLAQIRDIHSVTNLPLEAFVHGALCVSYSGRCYASEYCFGRSANRGRCAQFCRLAFDLVDADGHVLETDKHLLSLRDMNRSQSLEEMMDAGVSSFKIEGRLKDPGYVKNVTAYYRKAIDNILAKRPDDFSRSSVGNTELTFEPQLVKSFNRGFTEYFLHKRTDDLWNFSTPKSTGEYVGQVRRVGKRSFLLDGSIPLNNGDGLVFFNAQQKLEGFRANKVEGREVFPLKMTHIPIGTAVYRNEDREWETALSRPTAKRSIPIHIHLSEKPFGYTLSAVLVGKENEAAENILCRCDFTIDVQKAAKPQRDNIIRNLSKLGDTPFTAHDITLDICGERFIPASQISEMRRTLVESATEALVHQYELSRDKRRYPSDSAQIPSTLTYTANVSNRQSLQWVKAHGAKAVAPAFEVRQPQEGALMTCRHCLRYALGQCPKETGRRPAWNEPLSLRLHEGRKFPLRFDCSRCEMQVMMPHQR